MCGDRAPGEKTGVVIRPYVPGDEMEINRSFNEVFKKDRSLVQWQQKFANSKYIMVAVGEGGRVVGHCAAIGVTVQVDGRQLQAGQVVDVFTLPSARRGLAASRVLLATMERFFERFGGRQALSFVYGFPGLRHFHLGVKQLGYVAAEKVPVWRAVARPRQRFFWGVEVLEEPPQTTWERLWQLASPRYPVAGVRNREWLERRFPAEGQYFPFAVTSWGRPVLGGVLCRRERIVFLSELVWAGEERGLAAGLEYCRAFAWELRCQGVELWLAGDWEASQLLQRLGWRVTPHPEVHRVVRPLDPEVDVNTFPGRFLLTLGDTDLV